MEKGPTNVFTSESKQNMTKLFSKIVLQSSLYRLRESGATLGGSERLCLNSQDL